MSWIKRRAELLKFFQFKIREMSIKRTLPNGMIIDTRIPCLRACLREALWQSKARMPDYGMQACALKK
jgi:hypothetical protein